MLRQTILFYIMALVGCTMPASNITDMENRFIISANGKEMTATFADNSSARAFRELISDAPLTVEMSDYGGFEKVGDLGTRLPTNDMRITTQPGDVILYLGCNITIYYGVNTWSFTRLGKIEGNQTRESVLSVLGNGTTNVTFSIGNPAAGAEETVVVNPLKLQVSGRDITIDGQDTTTDCISIYTLDGTMIYKGAQHCITLPYPGMFIVACGNLKAKVIVK